MANLELGFFALTLTGLVLGCWGIAWARTSRRQACILIGRCVFVSTLLMLGGSGVLAAIYHIEGLVPLGFSSGFLVMGMLCEIPHPAWHD